MARTVTFEVPTDTSQFTPLQLQPRTAFTLGMVGWARWLRDHWHPFPRLIQDHNLGVVILGLDVGYERSFGFFDSDTLVATAGLTVRSDGRLLVLTTRIAPPEGPEVARVTGVLRPVHIADDVALSAAPTDLDGDHLSRFEADEITTDVPRPHLKALVDELEEQARPLATLSRSFTLHRHLCEAADQWSGIALPDVTTEVREALVTEMHGDIPALTVALTHPVQRVTFEFGRPAFFLDAFTVDCAAYRSGDDIVFVHRFSSGGEERIATCVEWFSGSESSSGKGGRQ